MQAAGTQGAGTQAAGAHGVGTQQTPSQRILMERQCRGAQPQTTRSMHRQAQAASAATRTVATNATVINPIRRTMFGVLPLLKGMLNSSMLRTGVQHDILPNFRDCRNPPDPNIRQRSLYNN
jgi:hypothetical protein